MGRNGVILLLLVLIAVVGIFMTGSPEHSERLSQMYRDASFTGRSREIALFVLALGIGGFILYLTISRR